MTTRYSPPNFQDIATRLQSDPKGTGRDLDQALQLAFKQNGTNTTALEGMRNGATTVTGSALRIATGLSSVTNVVATLESSTAINEWVTVALSATPGAIELRVWKPTGVADTTPIPSTTARVVRWAVWGAA